MNIFLLVITIILLFYRIKGTPRMLSKKKYLMNIQEAINKNKDTFANKSSDDIKLAKTIALIFIFILQFITAFYYIVTGCYIGGMLFTILSVLEILTVIYTTASQCNNKAFSFNIEDFKFHRIYLLFNVLLDYVYYILAIYMLLFK